MRIVSTLALALALGGVSLAAPAYAKKEEKAAGAKYTPAVANGYNAVKKALDAGDVAGATAQYQALKGQVQTDDDKLIVGSLAVGIGQKANDNTILGEGIDMMIASGKAPKENLASLYFEKGRQAYNAKDYATAQRNFTQAQQAGMVDDKLVPLIVDTMQRNGQTLQALQTLNAAIDANVAAGKPTPAEWFQRGLSIGYQTKTGADMAAVTDQTSAITRKWVAAYPTKANWHDAMITYMSQSKAPRDVQIDVFRLLRAAGALTGDADYREYATNVYLRYPNEAKTVLEEGAAKGVVNVTGKNDASDILGIVKAKTAADKASLAGGEKNARAAGNGTAALTMGDAYAGYGDYAKAIDLYKVAIQKGGIDVPTANLRIGWAMALSGDSAGAKQQFATVTGPRKPLADFWITHLDHPTQG